MKLTMYRGDSAVFDIACKQADGSPLDITSGTLFFTVKSSARQSDADAIVQKDSDSNGITVANGSLGLATITLAPSDTDGIYVPAQLVWDLQYVTVDSKAFTLMDGTLLVKADVTNRTASAYSP